MSSNLEESEITTTSNVEIPEEDLILKRLLEFPGSLVEIKRKDIVYRGRVASVDPIRTR